MRTVDSNMYIHDLDRKAMRSLKAIPAFSQVMKAFMGAWNEQLFYIENMSTNLRISEKQLPAYHAMLEEACAKLGIAVPEMYLKLDVNPNAYTYGDTKPFIVLTSGLIETLPGELIPTVIAHECGHIACRHTLYTTMGNLLCGGLLNALPFDVAQVASMPVIAAFSYWMRCSEFSADRAAVLCDGGAEKMKEVCARFAGFDKDIPGELNMDAFMEQAAAYVRHIEDGPANSIMEFIQYFDNDHPLNAVRAYECDEWQKSAQFDNLMNYIHHGEDGYNRQQLPLCDIAGSYVGQPHRAVIAELSDIGFSNVELVRKTDRTAFKKAEEGQVVEFAINGLTKCGFADWYAPDALIEIAYYQPFSDEELQDQHPGEKRLPLSSRRCVGKQVSAVEQAFRDAGFTDITVFEQKDLKRGLFVKEGSVARVTIDADSQFEEGEWRSTSAPVRITYRTLK